MARITKTDKIIEKLEHEIAIRQYAVDRLREQQKPTAAKVRTEKMPRMVTVADAKETA